MNPYELAVALRRLRIAEHRWLPHVGTDLGRYCTRCSRWERHADLLCRAPIIVPANLAA